MENYITKDYDFYSDIDREGKIKEYKFQIDNAIKKIMAKGARLVFANVVKVGDISNITVLKYPELRGYILDNIKFEKEMYVINQKINRALARMIKVNKKVTFIGLMNSCRFNSDDIYNNTYIKERIREVVIEHSNSFYNK
ncbi:MAG: hypothetical protein RSA29_08500 [Clostridium sp.]|uniref:hypothetical protein n=1 Tax=Clostridium sp. TaxID=1506 RepID=UPI00305907FC